MNSPVDWYSAVTHYSPNRYCCLLSPPTPDSQRSLDRSVRTNIHLVLAVGGEHWQRGVEEGVLEEEGPRMFVEAVVG